MHSETAEPTTTSPKTTAANCLSAKKPTWFHTPFGVLILLLALQVITGTLMMTVYSPAPATAWGSVWYFQNALSGGWFIRGLHTISSDAMIIFAALGVLQWIVSKLYRCSGFIAWSLTIALVPLTLAIALCGELLPWDQHGFWATQVRTNILARTPLMGESLRQFVIGGNDFGHLTLTRFYTLHVIVLPFALALVLWWRSRLSKRVAGTTVDASLNSIDGSNRSSQFLRDSVVFFVVFVAILGLVWNAKSKGVAWLDAPADPAASNYPARPQWHTLFLYQWLKYFQGPAMEQIGAIFVPAGIFALLLSFPILDRGDRLKWMRAIPNLIIVLLVCGIGALSYAAVRSDRNPTDAQIREINKKQNEGEPLSEADERIARAQQFHQQLESARRRAKRSFFLADTKGIPPEGPLSLLMNDPVTRGPELFAEHCATCHRFDGHDGLGRIPSEQPTSSDLAGYASQEWIRSFLSNPMADRFFGRMKKPDGEPAHTRMSNWLRETRGDQENDEDRRRLMADFDAVASYLADEARYPGRLAHIQSDDTPSATGDTKDALILRGRRFFMTVCNECHRYKDQKLGTLKAPEMLGYGSVRWIELMIADPSHDTRYRSRGKQPAQMPSFQDRLTQRDRHMLAEWLHMSGPADSETP